MTKPRFYGEKIGLRYLSKYDIHFNLVKNEIYEIWIQIEQGIPYCSFNYFSICYYWLIAMIKYKEKYCHWKWAGRSKVRNPFNKCSN